MLTRCKNTIKPERHEAETDTVVCTKALCAVVVCFLPAGDATATIDMAMAYSSQLKLQRAGYRLM